MNEVRFGVDGDPVAQPRPRAGVDWRLGRARVYRQEGRLVHGWRGRIALAARKACARPLEGALELVLVFRFHRARRRTGPSWRSTRPDVDNLAKVVADALNGIAWEDDGQVARLVAEKHWVAGDDQPGVLVRVRALA